MEWLEGFSLCQADILFFKKALDFPQFFHPKLQFLAQNPQFLVANYRANCLILGV